MFGSIPQFSDRRDAGQRLAAALKHHRGSQPLVLALPRGGVPVAFEVAQRLTAPLDLVLVRKIGAPDHAELALGAVVGGAEPQLVLNDDVIRMVAPPPDYIAAEQQRQLAEIERRRRAYLGDRPPPVIAGTTVIVVDDGIATGATMRAALRALVCGHPARLILAVPVAPADAIQDLSAECDEIVCLKTPEPFYAVGLHYRDFTQTEDDEVVRLLTEADANAGGAR